MLNVLAQGEMGPTIEPLLVPGIGVLVLCVAIGVVALAAIRRVDVETPVDPFPPTNEIEYATRRPRARRRTVLRRWFWPAAFIAVAAYLAIVAWDFSDRSNAYRWRTTTLQLIDSKTGVPVTTEPADIDFESDVEDFEYSQHDPSPGTVEVRWNHACTLTLHVPGYADAGTGNVVHLDEKAPAVVRVRLDPK